MLAMHGQDLTLEPVGETVDLDAALCILDIREHHYRESVKVKHGVQIQALLGLRDTSVDEQLLLGELVNNRKMMTRKNCYAQGIHLLVVNDLGG